MVNGLSVFPSRNSLFNSFGLEFDKLLNETFSKDFMTGSKCNYPKLNMYEKDDNLIINYAVPGVAKESLKLELLDNVFTVSAKMSHEYCSENNLIVELSRGYFERSVKLPKEVIGEPEAVLKNGMLTVTFKINVPKEKGVKSIPVKIE